MFSCKFRKIFSNTYIVEHSQTAASGIIILQNNSKWLLPKFFLKFFPCVYKQL